MFILLQVLLFFAYTYVHCIYLYLFIYKTQANK